MRLKEKTHDLAQVLRPRSIREKKIAFTYLYALTHCPWQMRKNSKNGSDDE